MADHPQAPKGAPQVVQPAPVQMLWWPTIPNNWNDFSFNFWVPKKRFKKNAIPFLGEWLFLILGDSYSMGLIIPNNKMAIP